MRQPCKKIPSLFMLCGSHVKNARISHPGWVYFPPAGWGPKAPRYSSCGQASGVPGAGVGSNLPCSHPAARIQQSRVAPIGAYLNLQTRHAVAARAGRDEDLTRFTSKSHANFVIPYISSTYTIRFVANECPDTVRTLSAHFLNNPDAEVFSRKQYHLESGEISTGNPENFT